MAGAAVGVTAVTGIAADTDTMAATAIVAVMRGAELMAPGLAAMRLREAALPHAADSAAAASMVAAVVVSTAVVAAAMAEADTGKTFA
jgi:predicted ribosome-associated RNA-binding protein Tma20